MKFTAAALAASVSVIATMAQAETFSIQTSFNAGDFSTQYLTETWLPKIKEMTDGRVEIQLTPNGSVVPARETPDAVAAGVLDGDFTSVNYFAGREPAYAIMGDLISGYDTPQQMIGFCKDGGGEAVMQKAADAVTGGEVQVVACGPYSREALPARVPIRTFEDLEGKKIRSPEGLAAAVFQAAGASPVSIPFSEVYGALEKGIVDAADASAYVNNDATGLHDVAPYPLYPGIHSMPSMQFTINKAKWDALSPEDQKALRDWWYEAMFAMAAEVDKKDQELAARDGAGEKIEVINWAQEDRDQLREIARKEWENYAQKSDLAKEALDANLSYMTEIGLFKN
ncbi:MULTISPECIES: TRAP transporter substrate-binding protein DctP [Stappiaceae]|jgi:TRAP-type C4-dicarboxylate transport system substrate-binding protein|uniref:Extracytoplasmic solute receptor protein YiaO n=2 Tax=Roseibium TaxID=150830 RepID=A0A0M6Y087_9HYPH|nr:MULTISPECIES: TRAP transporter substrate-binding protein DctP [Stappiaceae]MCR9280870.1 TRAP transporter substrate-binding protein DctP [Paracoccaceae bacterium]MEC9419229.1 TRAP transporter substrate-binding protein DctP [Pseudomonadota bacterium]AMN52398.1 C4-dicarboxylate ABC transporter substrate-binding protein [Labrenzia sp. CP4]AQQ05604.1 C4-dicarboxylate ABC transporter substrate-binding protein [Roseibium aggregatum]ERP98432.1 C4-dicarboxylate ABC transporter substrate-binding prot